MAARFLNNLTRRLTVGPSGAISYPSTGWTVFGMFSVDNASQNNPAYMYNHGQPAALNDSISVTIVTGLPSTIKFVVEDSATVYLSAQPFGGYTVGTWYAFALVWDGTNFRVYYDGSESVIAPTGGSPGTLTPPGEATLGLRSDLMVNTAINGRLCHVAKFDRALTSAEGIRYTDTLFSPEFVQNSKDWHVEMFNADFSFDLQGNRTTTQTSMVFETHAPVVYPSMTDSSFEDEDTAPDKRSRLIYVGA